MMVKVTPCVSDHRVETEVSVSRLLQGLQPSQCDFPCHAFIIGEYADKAGPFESAEAVQRPQVAVLTALNCSMTKEDSEMQQLLKERSAARSSLQMADRYLESFRSPSIMRRQAAESHTHLIEQGKRLEAGRGRVVGITSRFPVVNDLLKQITDRKNREK